MFDLLARTNPILSPSVIKNKKNPGYSFHNIELIIPYTLFNIMIITMTFRRRFHVINLKNTSKKYSHFELPPRDFFKFLLTSILYVKFTTNDRDILLHYPWWLYTTFISYFSLTYFLHGITLHPCVCFFPYPPSILKVFFSFTEICLWNFPIFQICVLLCVGLLL